MIKKYRVLLILVTMFLAISILAYTQKYHEKTHRIITAYGASSDLADNSAAINKAIARNNNVIIPEGSFSIQSMVKLKNGLTIQGTRELSKIVIDDTFNVGNYFPESEFAIMNADFSKTYNATTADEITIRGITFVMTNNNPASITTILGFANIKKLTIEDCDFIIENHLISGNNMDLYAGCKNVVIRDCYFKNDTGAAAGCGIMVRCFTADGALFDNETANVLIENNKFDKNGNDEVVAVWGGIGQVRDVTVRRNEINTYGRVPSVIISAFAGERNAFSTARAENITFADNHIVTDSIAATVIQVGQKTDNVAELNNIKIINNTIAAQVQETGLSNVIKSINQPQHNNIIIDSNTITNTGSINIAYGINGKGEVSNNVINGLFNASIANGDRSYGNTINNNLEGAAIENVRNAEKNIINNCRIGIKCFYSDTFYLTNNTIRMADYADSFGIQALNVDDSYPIIYVNNNEIINTNNSSKQVFSNGGMIREGAL
ncbi:MAG: hypothetical protein WC147_08060 [Syntrophomonas sp.]